jgi:heme-degrading monooxygenase HmoA
MYLIVWKYEVLDEHEEHFRGSYGPDGDWTRLFAQHDGFLGTELIAIDEPGRYMTIDRWEGEQSFNAFMERDQEAYRRLDERFETFTISEDLVGRGNSVGSGVSG